jgi:transketolase N-terminal domain/subunit
MMAMEPEDMKDLRRAHVVLSKGHEVVGPGYGQGKKFG